MIAMGKYLLSDPHDYSRSHLIVILFKVEEHLTQGLHKGLRVDDVEGDEIVGVLGLVKDVGEVVFGWELQGFGSIDLKIIFADFLAY